MSAWGVLADMVACAVGVLVFLDVVAHQITWTQSAMDQREKCERGAYDERNGPPKKDAAHVTRPARPLEAFAPAGDAGDPNG